MASTSQAPYSTSVPDGMTDRRGLRSRLAGMGSSSVTIEGGRFTAGHRDLPRRVARPHPRRRRPRRRAAVALRRRWRGSSGEQRDRAHDQHNVRVRAIGVACAGPIERNCETVSPASVPSWRRFELRQHLRELTGLPVFGDLDAKATTLAEGWLGRGTRCPELLHDRGVDARRRRARARRRPRRRGHRQRRQRRPHHRRTRRTALHVRCPWLPRVGGFGRRDQHDHGSPADRADVRHHAAHRTARRSRGGHDLHRARSRSRRRRRRRGARASRRRSSMPPRRRSTPSRASVTAPRHA